jgi:hypothetical protein
VRKRSVEEFKEKHMQLLPLTGMNLLLQIEGRSKRNKGLPMALPSLNDVVFVIVLLIPGFITLVSFRWFAVLEKKLSDFELIIWSVFVSLLIYSILGWHVGITNFDKIRDYMLLPENLLKILGLSLLLGIGVGSIVKIAFRRPYVRGDCWEASMRAARKVGSWLIVYTSDGREYKGILHYTGGPELPKEISIRKPKLMIRDSEGYLIEEVEIGKEILFAEKDIARIVFFKEV